jgi:hypothetical protein
MFPVRNLQSYSRHLAVTTAVFAVQRLADVSVSIEDNRLQWTMDEQVVETNMRKKTGGFETLPYPRIKFKRVKDNPRQP